MLLNRVFYDQDLRVIAIHPADTPIEPSVYAGDGRTISSMLVAPEDVPSIMIEEREVLVDENGVTRHGAEGRPQLGRIVNYRPRFLEQDWIDGYTAPVQEVIDSTKGKLALLDADKLDAWASAIDAISNAKEKMAAKLKFDAPTWTRSDPLWNELGTAASQSAKAVDDIWRAAVA